MAPCSWFEFLCVEMADRTEPSPMGQYFQVIILPGEGAPLCDTLCDIVFRLSVRHCI